MTKERLLALFQRDGIDHRFALNTLQRSSNDLPMGRVYHKRYARDVGLRSQEPEEMLHLGTGIEKAVVHIDIQHQCPVIHLTTSNRYRLPIIMLGNQAQEFARASHIAPFADIDERTALPYSL